MAAGCASRAAGGLSQRRRLGRPALQLGAAHHARQGRLDLWLLRDPRQDALRQRHLAGDLDAGHRRRLARRRRDRHPGARGPHPGRVFGTVHTLQQRRARQRLRRACPLPAPHSTTTRCTGRPTRSPSASTASCTTATPTRAPAARWPFDAPQYLLLNIAIGGDLGGAVDDTIFPLAMEIEHVRVYQAPR